MDVREIGTNFARRFFNRISGRQRIRYVPDQDDARMIRDAHNLRRHVTACEVAVCFQCDTYAGRSTLRNFTQTGGDVVARLIPRCGGLNFVREYADQRRVKSVGKFSIPDSHIDLSASLFRIRCGKSPAYREPSSEHEATPGT